MFLFLSGVPFSVDGGDSPIGGESEPLYQQLQQQQLGRLASPALSTSSQEHNDDALLTLKSPGPLETGNVDPLASALLQRTGTPPSDEASKKAKKPLLVGRHTWLYLFPNPPSFPPSPSL